MITPELESALLKALRWAGDEFGEPIELGQRTFARAAERAGLHQVEPLPLLRRRVRVAPVSTLLRLQRAICAVELAQGVCRG